MVRSSLVILLCAAPALAQVRPFTPEELLQTRRLDDVQISADGKRAAFTVRQKRLDDNRDARDVWLLDLPSGTPKQFTRDGHSDHPRFSPDGKKLLVVSDRAPGTEPQLYLYDLDIAGDARKLTSLHNGASDGVFSPDGRMVAFVSEVHPSCTGKADEIDACIKKRADEKAKSKVRARVIDRLMYRHWNEWRDNKRNHVFVLPLDGGPARDLTPGDSDWPTWRLGGGGDLAFSRDGKAIYLSHKKAEGEAWRTNSDIYSLPVDGGQPRSLTEGNAGDDASPAVSPDGRWLAWKAQARNGYESDQWRLRFLDLGSGKTTAVELPEDVGAFRWKRDSSGVVAEMAVQGRQLLTTVSLDGRSAPFSKELAGNDFALAPDGSAWVVVAGLVRPPELHRFAKDSGSQRITRFNDEQYSGLNLGTVEEQWVESSDGAKVHSWIVKPANVKRAPLLVLVHGGPQGAWGDGWTMRWNAAAFAARGYIVLMPNPRGSTTYGPKFKEEISQDWGGKVFDDVMRSVDAAEKRPDVEPGRTCAAGASYGGYFVNWIAGHTDRFKCLVSHAGVFDLVSEYGTTEELWFPEWEFGGPYWQNMEHYRKFSPSSYVQNFKTPTLVTMGELDFRVPMEQPFQMFTALQRRGVESRLLSFPDEGHWINKPRNALLWYRTVLEWIDAHAKGATRPEPSAVR